MNTPQTLLACLLAGMLLLSGCFGILEDGDEDDGQPSTTGEGGSGGNGGDGDGDGGGESADSDGDGVDDAADDCPGTTLAASVDANGCSDAQLDSDADGVANSDDACPNTPAATTVDSQGCPEDPPADPPPAPDATHFVNGSCPLAGDGSAHTCAESAGGTGAFNDLPTALLALTPGDLLQIAPGRYVGRFVISTIDGHVDGEPDARITVRGETGVELVGDNITRVTLQVKTSFWTFEDLRIVNDGEGGAEDTAGQVKVRGPVEGVILRGLDVDGQMRSLQGIGIACIEEEGCPSNTLLENLTVYDQWLQEDDDAHCVYLDSILTPGHRVEQTTIRNLTAFGCDGDGVQIHQDKEGNKSAPNGTLIEDSHFYRAYAPGREENAIDVKAGTNVTIRNNRIHGFVPTPTSPPGSALVIHMGGGDTLVEGNEFWDSSCAIRVAHGSGADTPRNVTIRNNVIRDSTMSDSGHGVGIFIDNTHDIKVLHNTIVRCAGACIEVTGSVTGVVLANNIIIGGDYELNISTQLAGNSSLIQIHHNLLRDSSGGRGKVNGNAFTDVSCSDCVDGDPLFNDSTADDFHLGVGSAAIDAGTDLGVSMDADGCSRNSPPDIGAFEWVTDCQA